VPESTLRPPRRISCHLERATVVIDLSADDDMARLYLTHDEAQKLATDLLVELICSNEHSPAGFVVADVPLTTAEAWELVDAIGDLLRGEDADHRLAKSGDRANWLKEGF
jgi:hypothetical protein